MEAGFAPSARRRPWVVAPPAGRYDRWHARHPPPPRERQCHGSSPEHCGSADHGGGLDDSRSRALCVRHHVEGGREQHHRARPAARRRDPDPTGPGGAPPRRTGLVDCDHDDGAATFTGDHHHAGFGSSRGHNHDDRRMPHVDAELDRARPHKLEEPIGPDHRCPRRGDQEHVHGGHHDHRDHCGQRHRWTHARRCRARLLDAADHYGARAVSELHGIEWRTFPDQCRATAVVELRSMDMGVASSGLMSDA